MKSEKFQCENFQYDENIHIPRKVVEKFQCEKSQERLGKDRECAKLDERQCWWTNVLELNCGDKNDWFPLFH